MTTMTSGAMASSSSAAAADDDDDVTRQPPPRDDAETTAADAMAVVRREVSNDAASPSAGVVGAEEEGRGGKKERRRSGSEGEAVSDLAAENAPPTKAGGGGEEQDAAEDAIASDAVVDIDVPMIQLPREEEEDSLCGPPLPPQMVADDADGDHDGRLSESRAKKRFVAVRGLVEQQMPSAPFNVADMEYDDDDDDDDDDRIRRKVAADAGKKPAARENDDETLPATTAPVPQRVAPTLEAVRADAAAIGDPETVPETVAMIGGDDGASSIRTDDAVGEPTRRTLSNCTPHISGAFLAEEEDDEEDAMSLYDGVPVPDEEAGPAPPWWRRYSKTVALVAALSVAVIVAAVVGASVVASGSDDIGGAETQEGNQQKRATAPPTMSPTLSPPPLNCSVSNLGPLFEGNCVTYGGSVARDGDSHVAVYGEGDSEIRFLPIPHDEGTPDDGVPASHPFDHRVDDIALAGRSFFASYPEGYDGGSVFASARDTASGNISNETTRIAPSSSSDSSRPPLSPWAEFGASIAASNDGGVLAVGAPYDGGAGSAFVYRREGANSWTEEARLIAGERASRFGISVLVARDGDFVVVAAKGDDGADVAGAVYFYEYDPLSSSWRQLTKDTLRNEECDGNFGASLALTIDEGLLVGCPMEDDYRGAVYFYQRSGGDRRYEFVHKIRASDGESLNQFGGNHDHIAVNSNGDLVAIGTLGELTGHDQKVYVFANFDNYWSEVAKIDAPEGTSHFGTSVAISQWNLVIVAWDNTYSYALACTEQES